MTTCPRCQRSYDDAVRFCPVDGALLLGADPNLSRNIGRILYGQFELRELAGRGATGTVWRAYQRSMDRIVAVKILHRELAQDPDIVRRFLREARAIAKIAHPNIITVHLVGETEEGTPYLVMEHVDGISLETTVEAQGPLPIPRVVHLARQIALGLGEAHANGIIHRDLKPANLLITDRGRIPDLVKILDFGIAKLIEAGKEASQLTRGQQIFGTPHYMAPEQAAGEPIDARTDLYALGVVLFRLTTGVVPFDAPAGMQVVLRHLRDQPPKPRILNPLIPDGMEELILACLSKKPSDRPRDADDVVAALDRLGVYPPPPPRPQTAAVTPSGLRPRVIPPVTGQLSGTFSRPEPPPRDRSAFILVGFLVFIGLTLFAVTRFGARPPVADPQVAAPDLAEERRPMDLAVFDERRPEDLAHPPDLAKKKRRHSDEDDDLPTTVFGPEGTK